MRVHIRPNLTLSVEDLATQVTWGSDPWENSAGRVHLHGKHGEAVTVSLSGAAQKKFDTLPAANGAGLQISLSDFRSRMGPVRDDRDPGAHLSLVLQILLAKDSPELTLRIQEMSNRSQYWEVEKVEWPLRLFPVRTVDDDGYVVFPQQEGMLIPSRFEQGYFRYLNWIWERIAGQAAIFEQSSMPWYGAKLGQSSFLCIVETPDDMAYGVIANDVRSPEQPAAPASAVPAATTALYNPRLSAVWPYWHSVKGELGYARAARYIFQPRGGYVEMCKTYRAYVEKTGKLVTLKQKIAANPKVEKLIGAPNFEIQVVAHRALAPQYQGLSGPVYDGYHRLQTSFDQITAMIHDMKEKLGVDRAVIRIAGWGRKGYDNDRPVDAATQVNAEAGGPEKLAAAIASAKAAGFLGGLWDNYRNFDLNSPSYDEKLIVRDSGGALVNGFSSEAGFSQEICPIESLKLFQSNMDSYMRALKPDLIYLDTIGGLPLIECYTPLHPLARSGTREQRLNIMRVATQAGAVLGVEGPPQDWNLPVAAFYDESNIRFGIEAPLWSLVYHDSGMLYRQHASPYNYGMDNYGYSRGPWPAKFLRGILYGDQSSWTVSNAAYLGMAKDLQTDQRRVGDWTPEEFDTVWSDDVQGAFDLTSHLIADGHRDIWFIGDIELPWYARCAEGYRQSMLNAGLLPRLSEIQSDDRQLGYLATRSILSRREPVTAIFASSDQIARGVYEALYQSGLSVPDDISVAGFNDSEAALLHPPLTSVAEFPEELGRHLAGFVLRRAQEPDREPQKLTIPTRVVVRESTKPMTPRGLALAEPHVDPPFVSEV